MRPLKLAKLNGNAEIFHTLQGEGVSSGMPAVFIRSSLCNLHCIWCDTDYTWNWKNTPWKHENDVLESYEKYNKSDYIIEPPLEDITQEILQYDCPNLIITGGEPLLQQEGWITLLTTLRNHNPQFRFEVETNGTQTPCDELAELIEQFNVSPKLSNSANKESLRISPASLTYFSQHPKAWFKFVVAQESDLGEIQQLISKFSLPKEKIILMPEGRTQSALNERRLWLAELCRDHGYRFADRLHIRLWGSKRGV